MKNTIDYELGYEDEGSAHADLGIDLALPGTPAARNREDIEAIDRYITGLAPQVERMRESSKLSRDQLKTWDTYWKKWGPWYDSIKNAWIVTRKDVEVARGFRDQINASLTPSAFRHLKATSAFQAPVASKKEIDEAVEDARKPFPWKAALLVGAATLTGLYVFGGVLAAKALRIVAKVA